MLIRNFLNRARLFFMDKDLTPEEKASEYRSVFSYKLKETEEALYKDSRKKFKELNLGYLTIQELAIISKEDLRISAPSRSKEYIDMLKAGIKSFDRRYLNGTEIKLSKEQMKARIYFNDIVPLDKKILSLFKEALLKPSNEKEDISSFISQEITTTEIQKLHNFDFCCLNNRASEKFIFNEQVIRARLVLAKVVPLPIKADLFIPLMISASGLSSINKKFLMDKYFPYVSRISILKSNAQSKTFEILKNISRDNYNIKTYTL